MKRDRPRPEHTTRNGALFTLAAVVIALAASYCSSARAEDARLSNAGIYCGPPQRYENGEIIRSAKVKAAFRKLVPCPSTGNISGSCPGWQINHTVPLICNGCDSVWNLSWVPTILKAGPGLLPVDRWERQVYCVNQRELVIMPDPQKFRLEATPR